MTKTLFTILIAALPMYHVNAQKPEKNISASFPYEMKAIEVNGIQLKYYEQGNGEPVLFLHGIPTSSYLWRNVVPLVAIGNRAIALDLAGYGQSDLPANKDYSFQLQYTYLKKFIEKMELRNVTLVVNDLGSALGIKYAVEHENNVKAIVMIESVFMPAHDWHKQLTMMQKMMFSMFRKYPGMAEKMIVTKNRMPDMVLKMGTSRKLSANEKEFYLEPYKNSVERRRVYLSGPGPATFQKKGLSQNPGDFSDALDQNAKGLLSFSKPILLLYASPGLIVQKEAIQYAKVNFKKCTIVNIGKGKHFLPEDHPSRIGNEINSFYQTTLNKTNMKQVSITKSVNASAEEVWNILRTGTDLDKWIPFISTCKLEGKGVGAKRVCTTADGKVLKETILLVDEGNRIFKYRIDEQDVLPTKNYVGTVSVKDSMGKTEVMWVADFEMTMEAAWPEVEKGLTNLLTEAISGLETAAKMN
ncbi:MAG TPA: haloalkane dehalogenase [Chryseolinea sp.]|nr:haloalkane dehalogenase [Chryseolinea sp.]